MKRGKVKGKKVEKINNSNESYKKWIPIGIVIVIVLFIIIAFAISYFSKRSSENGLNAIGPFANPASTSTISTITIPRNPTPTTTITPTPTPGICNPPCNTCTQYCDTTLSPPSCKSTGMKKCSDGACVSDNGQCDCTPKCNACTQSCVVSQLGGKVCEPDTSHKLCPNGACIRSYEECSGLACNPPCGQCQKCDYITKTCFYDSKPCTSGICVDKNSECPKPDPKCPTCDICTQYCNIPKYGGGLPWCAPSGMKRCPDGRCVNSGSSCTVFPTPTPTVTPR